MLEYLALHRQFGVLFTRPVKLLAFALFQRDLTVSSTRRSRFAYKSSVPSCSPSSRATCAIGLPVPERYETVPSQNSRSTLRLSITITSFKTISLRYVGEAQNTGSVGADKF